MIIERTDLVLSRLKQGFDSPRERQQKQALSGLANSSDQRSPKNGNGPLMH
jgi:hypothetical protein